jgi:hypothetical protein
LDDDRCSVSSFVEVSASENLEATPRGRSCTEHLLARNVILYRVTVYDENLSEPTYQNDSSSVVRKCCALANSSRINQPHLTMASRRRRAEAALHSPRASSSAVRSSNSLANSRTVPEETDKALLEVLNGPERYNTRHFQVYDANQAAFGGKNSELRAKVHKRRQYLEKARVEQPVAYYRYCLKLGVAAETPAELLHPPTTSAPPRTTGPATVAFHESELTHSPSIASPRMSSSKNRSGKNEHLLS